MAKNINANELDLQEQLVVLNRVSKTVKGGRIARFAAIMVVGDGNGLFALALLHGDAFGVEILQRGGAELTAVFFNSLAGIKHRLYPEKPFFGKLSEIYAVYYTLGDEKPRFAACLFAFVKLAVKLYLRVILA